MCKYSPVSHTNKKIIFKMSDMAVTIQLVHISFYCMGALEPPKLLV